MAKLSPIYIDAQFINAIPATGAKVFTYASGSSTKQATYTDITGLTAQANPIVLNSRGEPASPIWLTEGLSYKFVFAPSTDSDPPVSPIRTIDNVTGVNDSSITIDQWVVSGITPTYVSATQFTLPGDQTTNFQLGRRIKATVTAGTVYGTITASVFAALTTVTLSMDSGQALDSGLSAVSYGLITTTPNSLPYAFGPDKIQSQTYTAFNTGGTSAAFTLTPTPAITANTANQLFFVKFNAAPTGSPTLAVSGQTALNLKYYDASGSKQFVNSSVVPINWQSDVYNDGTDWVVLDVLQQSKSPLQPILATVAANALTITVNPTSLDYRSTTLNSGAVTSLSLGVATALVIPNTATLGTTNAVQARLAVLLINNAGTLEPAVVNLAGGVDLSETGVINTTAIAAASNSATTIYSTTARTGVAYKVVGYIDITEATAGTWATAPVLVQGIGGNNYKSVPLSATIRLNTSNGYGSTNTVIRRFTNIVTNTGTDVTYADSATLGASLTINTPGIYTISYSDGGGAATDVGLSLNSAQLTTSINTITVSTRLIQATSTTAGGVSAMAWTGYLSAGDVVRPHTAAAAAGTVDRTLLTIARVA